MTMAADVLARLQSQMSRGEVILLLGAGFSTSAYDGQGRQLPTGKELARELWEIAFPGDPFDEASQLGDIFYAAQRRNEGATRAFIKSRLSVDAGRLPGSYAAWFSAPWTRCYTLNLDDLELAVARRFSLQRPVRSVSATSNKAQGSEDAHAMEVVHLNGAIWDELSDMTFSDVDYGARLATPDAWYVKCTTDVTSRPVVFVGTELHEAPLWQYLELRKTKGPRGLRELRPGSYLVLPKLSRGREYFLRELNVDWIAMTADDFQATVLRGLSGAITEGHAALRAKQESDIRRAIPQLVSDLAERERTGPTEYLMGHEPMWADIKAGRAIQRECDARIYEISRRLLFGGGQRKPLVLSGTAGSARAVLLCASHFVSLPRACRCIGSTSGRASIRMASERW